MSPAASPHIPHKISFLCAPSIADFIRRITAGLKCVYKFATFSLPLSTAIVY